MSNAGPYTADELATLKLDAQLEPHSKAAQGCLRLIYMIEARDVLNATLSTHLEEKCAELVLLRDLEKYVRRGDDYVDEALDALDEWRKRQGEAMP